MLKQQLEFHQLLLAETRRRLFEEGIPRLKKCLLALSEEEIWHRPNAHSNSMGNLTLHLCGNVRQWILSGLGKQPDRRRRQAEFDQRDPIPRETLFRQLDELARGVEAVLQSLTPADLLATHEVQVYRETGVSILVHVVEHFSYHVGQMTYYVKWLKDCDMGYYPENLEVPGE
ncbi:MAG: DUF1572 domain-containing protein [Bacteroidetes bacterium]|nr:MAG: DUF1572 domain-containing protein [Bacteroidota bacterium]